MGAGKLQRLLARLHLGGRSHSSGDVPRGHFAVYVGERRERFVIPTWYLKQPAFVTLLQRAEEEFGADHRPPPGGLTIPCSVRHFTTVVSDMAPAYGSRGGLGGKDT